MVAPENKSRRGSQRLLQEAVEFCPDYLLASLQLGGGISTGETVSWVSPVRDDGYREYKDAEFIERLELTERLKTPLSDFWPRSGPRWDALGMSSNNRPILVEAKAHIPETASPGSSASAESSVQLIQTSLKRTRRFIAPRSTAPWAGTFYQYTNRLAHQYFLRELNSIDSVLIFLNFINAAEMNGPKTAEEWIGAKKLMHYLLQLPDDLENLGVFHVYLDAEKVPSAA
jgi:hypothetical protein